MSIAMYMVFGTYREKQFYAADEGNTEILRVQQ